METALPVENVPYDHSVEETGDVSEMTAEEYLSWVRDQSARMPAFFRMVTEPSSSSSSQQTQYMPHVPDIPTCPVELLPAVEWERNMIHDFSQLRMVSN